MGERENDYRLHYSVVCLTVLETALKGVVIEGNLP